ncbi:MAG: hypothetical protein AB7O80_13585 [Acetobacteraceae bacterium]
MTITVNGNVQASGWLFVGISGLSVYSQTGITKTDAMAYASRLQALTPKPTVWIPAWACMQRRTGAAMCITLAMSQAAIGPIPDQLEFPGRSDAEAKRRVSGNDEALSE